ncbi:sugar ABC transporter ATP-binding protein [Kibdelosporangium aridum]|uniref:Ribose transport system ATP-binding protein n=1 Tax=Kibdelosporangium aridum TaxID=2030 RepID=A0A1Y5XQC2_KIBAR|nr:sugar ABC transporter ATP-binding protein [Kibdelosporangium aridum]SMD11566.1 ribose transport system ATP-binding protein [Kibdelosporangium aridum]
MLEAVRVTKRFAGVPALRDVDFLLERGQVHALAGENGAGKSTLVKVLTGALQPDKGMVFHKGQPVQFTGPHDAIARGISTVYQDTNLIGSMSVSANLFLGREPRNRLGLVNFRQMHAAATRLLDSFGLMIDPRLKLRSFTPGVRQMIAIARAVDTDARVVILDEPTASLEPPEIDTLFEVIRKLYERDVAVVYISHQLTELYQICNRITVLRDGQVVHSGLMSAIGPSKLLATMLGRDLAEIHPHHTHSASRRSVLQAHGLFRHAAIDNVDIDVRAGEVVGLGGLHGSGRSETVKALAGLGQLDRGTVEVHGKPIQTGSAAKAIRAGIVLVPEDRKAEGLIPSLSVRENIVLAALPRLSRAGIVSRSKQDKVVETFMRRLRIRAASAEQPVRELSGGNQQKVMLARWLAMSPKVLLLDEPTRGIDVAAKLEVRALVDELAAQGLGIVLVSSDVQELVAGADRVVVLREGARIAELSGEQVTTDKVMSVIAEGPR